MVCDPISSVGLGFVVVVVVVVVAVVDDAFVDHYVVER